jgi:ribosomal protein S18 acetylase RimI-like enzyme
VRVMVRQYLQARRPRNENAGRMPLDEMLTLADANLAEFAREHARWLPPTRIEEHTDLLLTAAGTSAPGPWNAALALGPEAADPERVLEATRGFFDPLQHHASIYTRAHLDTQLELACRRRGFELGSDSPGMLLTAKPEPAEFAHGTRLERVRSAETARAFVEVAASAYETLQIPAAVTHKLLSLPARWCQPHSEAFVLYEGQLATACVLVLWSHGIAGLYWVGTLPEARRRGHAERVTRAACTHAFERGARMLVLQASRGGEPIYRRIGFQEHTRYRTYRRPHALQR